MSYNIAEKDRLKFEQAQEIANDSKAIFNKIGKDEWCKMMTKPIPVDTKDILQRCYLWLLDNYYNDHKGYALDAGCGVAPFVLRLESMGYNVTGLDMYLSKINFCEMLRQSYPDKKIDFTQGTVYRMPYYARWFDVCHSTMVIEHLRDPISGIREMARVAQVVTGIVHLGKNKDESPLHTWFMTRERIEIILGWLVKVETLKDYKIDYLDGDVCAMFVATTSPAKCSTVEDSRGVEVEVSKIKSGDSMEEDWEKSYLEGIKQQGKSVVEDNVLPIRLSYNSSKDIYTIVGDGTHRVNALKKSNIKTVRAIVSYIGEG